MAFKQLTGISFIADSVEDLKKLPSKRGLGASCFVVEDGKEYKCNSKGEWKPYSPTIIIEGGNIPGGSSDPNYYGGNSRAVQADWDQINPNAPDYIRNRPFFDTTKNLSIQTLDITEPFTVITREELGWPEDFFNYSYDQPNQYAVQKNLDLLGNLRIEILIDQCWLEETTDENGRIIRWIGEWSFEDSKTFLMYYYDDEPETIYIKTNRKGQFQIANIYKDHDYSFFHRHPEVIQSDWLIQNKESPYYINNKPFYHNRSGEQYEDMIVLEPIENQNIIQTTLSLNDYYLQDIFYNPNNSYYSNIKIKKTDLNGEQTEYIYEVQNILHFEEPPIDKYVKWIGDFPSIFGYDIDDINHFCLYCLPDEDCNTLYFEGEAGTYEFSLYSPEEIKKIDEEFLPKTVRSNWDEPNPESRSYIHNKPFYSNPSYTTNLVVKELQENHSIQRKEELNWFLNPKQDPNIPIQVYSDGIVNDFIHFLPKSLYLAEQDCNVYYIGDTPSINLINPVLEPENHYGFSFYVIDNDSDIIHYEGPAATWQLEQYHPGELRQLDREFLPVTQLIFRTNIDVSELEGITLEIANKLNDLIRALDGKYIVN